MLILFDIDGTLLLTQGAGIAAMGEAGREMFGAQFTMDGVEFSGRLDTLIWADLVRLNDIANGDAHHDRFRQTYGRKLAARLERAPTARLLPGVREIVHELAAIESITLGLLTGNYPETGRLKIERAGLDPDLFRIAAWGCEGQCRRDLPPVAMRRHAEQFGRNLAGRDVIVIGDTPHDIDCAMAHGCRSVGVATGQFSVKQLQDAGADLAVPDLSATDQLLGWMLQTANGVCKEV